MVEAKELFCYFSIKESIAYLMIIRESTTISFLFIMIPRIKAYNFS